MLNNRVLLIGVPKEYQKLLTEIKSEFLFFTIKDSKQFDLNNHAYEALIFNGELISLDMFEILKSFNGKPVYAIGKGPSIEGVTWLEPPPDIYELEKSLLDILGELRAPPEDTGVLLAGTVVKNKMFPSWGLGVVKEEMNDGLCIVRFPSVRETLKKDEQICHKSVLRIICTLKGIKNENN